MKEGRDPGSLLTWHLGRGPKSQDIRVVMRRPGGLALAVILPAAAEVEPDGALTRLLAELRPQGILPNYDEPTVEDLTWVLRRPPQNLGVECTEYLRWRGIAIDRETTQLIRRIIDLSADLRSISALARALYLSRRALGRKFMKRGLPVPSHWLHFGRLLRVAIRLQNSDESVLSVAYELGYPDGFSLSNQMHRLIGVRPSDTRERLGWEWILEAWLRREADTGGLAPELTVEVLQGRGPNEHPTSPTSMRNVGAPRAASARWQATG
jgi:AraC-like DNA-binding protein